MAQIATITCTIPGPNSNTDPPNIRLLLATALHGWLGDTSTVSRYDFQFTQTPALQEGDEQTWIICTIEFEPRTPELYFELTDRVKQMFDNIGLAASNFKTGLVNS